MRVQPQGVPDPTQVNIEKHYMDVGLEIEFSVHSQIRSLSGGQKVKVVLGAAVWMNPHIIILAQPAPLAHRLMGTWHQ